MKRHELSVFYDFYHFIRMLESVLEKGDLKPIFGAEDAPFNVFKGHWQAIMENLNEKTDSEKLHEIDAFFITLQNPSRFSERENAQNVEIEPEMDEEHVNGELQDKLECAIIYPPILPHHKMSDSHLVAPCDFVEFARDLSNLKIDDEMEKLLMEPEMTCLAEEDAKHEAFSTRIGRSFTFQKRSHFENENINTFRGPSRGSGRALARGATTFNRARTVYAKPNRERSLVTRPAAMHVDDYQKAEEAESDHEKDRVRNYSSGDGYDRGHSPRYRDRSPPMRDDRYRDRSPTMRPDSRRGGYRGSDRGSRGGYRGSPAGRGRGSFRSRGSRGMPRY